LLDKAIFLSEVAAFEKLASSPTHKTVKISAIVLFIFNLLLAVFFHVYLNVPLP